MEQANFSQNELPNIFSILDEGTTNLALSQKKAIVILSLSDEVSDQVFQHLQKLSQSLSQQVLFPRKQDSSCYIIQKPSRWVPKVLKYFRQDTSLIQMPALLNHSSHISSIASTYFFLPLFENVEQIKFIIATENYSKNMTNIVKVINKLSAIFSSAAGRLAQCIHLVSSNDYRNEEAISLLFQTKIENQNVSNRTIRDIFQEIYSSKRFHILQTNQPGSLQNLNKTWQEDNFLSLLGLGFSLQSFFNIDLNSSWSKVDEIDKEIFTSSIKKFLKFYQQIPFLLKQLFIDAFLEQWNHLVKGQQAQRDLENMFLNFEYFFNHLQQFVQQYDHFNTQEKLYSLRQKQSKEKTSNIIQIVKLIMEISQRCRSIFLLTYSCRDEQQYNYTEFAGYINFFMVQLPTIIQLLHKICTNQEQTDLLIRLEYIVVRGYSYFKALYCLDQYLMHDLKVKFTDYMGTIFPSTLSFFPSVKLSDNTGTTFQIISGYSWRRYFLNHFIGEQAKQKILLLSSGENSQKQHKHLQLTAEILKHAENSEQIADKMQSLFIMNFKKVFNQSKVLFYSPSKEPIRCLYHQIRILINLNQQEIFRRKTPIHSEQWDKYQLLNFLKQYKKISSQIMSKIDPIAIALQRQPQAMRQLKNDQQQQASCYRLAKLPEQLKKQLKILIGMYNQKNLTNAHQSQECTSLRKLEGFSEILKSLQEALALEIQIMGLA